MKEELKRIRSILSAVTGLEDDDDEYLHDAIKSINDLIEKPAQQEPVAYVRDEANPCYMSTVLHEHREQTEPVAKVCYDLPGHIGWNPNLTELPDEGASLYTHPQAREAEQQEPHIGWLVRDSQGKLDLMTDLEIDSNPGRYERLHKLYTRPQAREPLTDVQIEEIHQSTWIQSTATLNDFARAIEAKLKEKNT